MPVRITPQSRLPGFRSRIGVTLALATLFLFFAGSGSRDVEAASETRTLSFAHTHRDDTITVTFKRNGSYDEDGLKKLNHYLRDWRTDEVTRMDPQLFDALWEVYRDVGAKEPIHIVSSYRSPQTNSMLRRRGRGVAQFSQHTQGKAIDFFIPGVPLADLRAAGLRVQRGGVGFYPSSGSPFVHLDTGSIRHWPRMTHDQLARVFPDGKTVHVPTDGHPLKGYHLALAEVRRRGGSPSETSIESARNAGIATADASGSGRGLFAKLFGSKDEDEEVETKPRAQTPAPSAPRQQVAATVPLPRVRPSQAPAEPQQQGTFSLASTSSRPATLSAAPAATPTDIINSRWQASPPATESRQAAPVVATIEPTEPAPAVTASGARLAWITGPEGRPHPPRPPRDIEGVATEETTSSVAAWANNPGQNDRVPTELALAYAATSRAAEPDTRAATTAAPMGTVRANPAAVPAPNATVATRKATAQPQAQPQVQPTPVAQRSIDPWLRGIVLTPSVQHSLSVVMLAAPDYRTLRPLMHKPRSTVPMVFSNDPTLGLVPESFRGPAITFLPTIGVATTRTAGLN